MCFVDIRSSHLYKGVLTVSVKSVPVGVKGLIVSIPINLTLPGTRLVPAAPLTPTTDTGTEEHGSLCAPSLLPLYFFFFINKRDPTMVLPGFAVAFDTLSSPEHPPAVHTGAVFHRNAVSKVILVLVVRAVAAAVTRRTGSLETGQKCVNQVKPGRLQASHILAAFKGHIMANICSRLCANGKLKVLTYHWFVETVTGLLSRVYSVLRAVNTNLPISATWSLHP